MNHFTSKYVTAALNSAEESDFREFLKILSEGNRELETNFSYCMPDQPKCKKRKVVKKNNNDYDYYDQVNIANEYDDKQEISRIILKKKGWNGRQNVLKFTDEKVAYDVAKSYQKEWENFPYARVEFYPASLIGFLHKEFAHDDKMIDTTQEYNKFCPCPCKRCYTLDEGKKPICFSHESKI